MTKNREKKSRKIIFGSELFEPNNEPNFKLYQKIDKNREKKLMNSDIKLPNCILISVQFNSVVLNTCNYTIVPTTDRSFI